MDRQTKVVISNAMGKEDVKELEFMVEGLPPTVNHSYGRAANGRMFKTAKTSSWQKLAVARAKQASIKAFGTCRLSYLSEYSVRLEMEVYRSTWHCVSKGREAVFHRKDLDNFIKATQDAVFSALSLDDSQVMELHAKKIGSPGLAECTRIRIKFLY